MLNVPRHLQVNASPTTNIWLHRYAVLTAVATLGLIGMGGLVTSHGVGMAVPDWPTSYGYNMFALPFKFWKGGVFYEHTHRLWASGVGLLTVILAVWLWLKDSRAWLRWLGVGAVFLVVLQGVLGGLRVVLFKDQIGIFHAALAQLFFGLLCAIALFTSQWWTGRAGSPLPADGAHGVTRPTNNGLARLFLFTTVLIFIQLLIAATMRHQHAGLAIPDFPLAYGKVWPGTSAAAVAGYNARRVEIGGENSITTGQIWLQMAHRAMAVVILGAVAFCAWKVRSSGFSRFGPPEGGTPNLMQRLTLAWLGVIFIQAGLGAWTTWSNKAADVATAHVVVGALSLVMGALLTIIAFRFSGKARTE